MGDFWCSKIIPTQGKLTLLTNLQSTLYTIAIYL